MELGLVGIIAVVVAAVLLIKLIKFGLKIVLIYLYLSKIFDFAQIT